MKEGYFEERGIAYRISSFEGNRETLVFVHGLSGSVSAWLPFEKAFPQYNLVMIDLRGHGNSIRPKNYEDYALSKVSDDLSSLLTHLNVKKCILVSHSFGTLIAHHFACAHPQKISGLIYLSPVAYLSETARFSFVHTALAFFVLILFFLPFANQKRGRVDYSIFTHTNDFDPRRIIRDIWNTSFHSYFYCLEQIYATHENALWDSPPFPTLIVHGTYDRIIPFSHAKKLAGHITQSTFVPLQGANHIIVLNNVSEVTKAIQEFLNSLKVRSQSFAIASGENLVT
jgi:pimeloyl-ACP methyl ester carboxylesterase